MMVITWRATAYLSCVGIILGLADRAVGQEERDKINQQIARRLVDTIRDREGRYTVPARVAAAQTLGDLGVDAGSVVPQLVDILSDRRRAFPLPVDEALVEAMGRIGAAARVAIPALVRNMGMDRDLDRAVRAAVDAILTSAQVPADVAVLIQRLKDPDPAERLRAGKKLTTLGSDARAALPALTAALADPDADVRRQALQALQTLQPGAVPTRDVLGVFIRDLTDTDEAVRLRAAKALGRLGRAARFALPALNAAARSDPDEDVRRVAADAAARVQGLGP